MQAELKSHKLKFWCPGGAQNFVKKWEFFCNGYNELIFLCNGTDWHKIPAKNVNPCPLLNLNTPILKTFPSGVILSQNSHF